MVETSLLSARLNGAGALLANNPIRYCQYHAYGSPTQSNFSIIRFLGSVYAEDIPQVVVRQ